MATNSTRLDPSCLIERDRNRCCPICLNFGGEPRNASPSLSLLLRLSSLVSTSGKRSNDVTRPAIAAGHRRRGDRHVAIAISVPLNGNFADE